MGNEVRTKSFVRKCAAFLPAPGGHLQRRARDANPRSLVPPIVDQVLRSWGQPLDATTRGFMESRLGHNFDDVRVHTDELAAESAQAVNALAYTVGRNVVFGAGQYAPGTKAGQRLLAHELTHVVQQGVIAYSVPHELTIGPAHDRFEREADLIAARADTSGAPVGDRPNVAPPGLQRQPKSPANVDEKKGSEIKITPATRTIPQSEVEKQVPIEPVPADLPDKSPSGKGTPATKTETEPEIETSYQGSLADKKITTNIEVAIPMKPWKSGVVFGQPLVLGKELKAELEIGPPPPGPGALIAQPQAALKISLKALSYELESVKSRVKGLKEFGLSVTGEAAIDPAMPFARPELGIKGGLEAEYQIGHTPIFLQGKIGYEVKIPSQGPATAAPTADFGFKIVLP